MFIQIHIECLQWAWHSPKHRKIAVRIKHLPYWSWHYGKCSLNVEITEIFICFILFYIFLSFLQSHFKSKIYVSFKLLFSLSVTSDSLWPHGLQQARLPFPAHQQLPELTQTHVHFFSDAIQPSHPLLFPSVPAFNLSQQQSLFQWVCSSHQVAKVLEFQLQHQSFQWIFRIDFL